MRTNWESKPHARRRGLEITPNLILTVEALRKVGGNLTAAGQILGESASIVGKARDRLLDRGLNHRQINGVEELPAEWRR